MSAAEIVIKRGETLNLSLAFDNAGVPVDLTDVTITSQVRDPLDELIVQLPVTVPAPTTGVCGMSVTDTSQWPEGVLRCDVRVMMAGQTLLSETFAIRVNREVTRP